MSDSCRIPPPTLAALEFAAALFAARRKQRREVGPPQPLAQRQRNRGAKK